MAIVDDAREGKAIAVILDKYTYKNGRDIVTTWSDWLSWCCKVFEWRDIERAGGGSLSARRKIPCSSRRWRDGWN